MRSVPVTAEKTAVFMGFSIPAQPTSNRCRLSTIAVCQAGIPSSAYIQCLSAGISTLCKVISSQSGSSVVLLNHRPLRTVRACFPGIRLKRKHCINSPYDVMNLPLGISCNPPPHMGHRPPYLNQIWMSFPTFFYPYSQQFPLRLTCLTRQRYGLTMFHQNNNC